MKHYRHCSYSLQSCTMTVMALMAMATTAGAQQAGKDGYSTAADAEHPQLTDIPTLYVKTVSGQDPQSKETYVPCELWLVEDGQTTHYSIPALPDGSNGGIRGRGNSTWGATKKPWRLKFNEKVKLLGDDYANAKSWTLLANTFDKSLIRNALTHELGVFMGLEFCPAAKFVDLVMNGDYRGTYQISDQVEVRKKRVDISDDGWLLEYGNASDKVDQPRIDFQNPGGTFYGWIEVKNPEFDNDDINANPELKAAIEAYMNDGFAKKMNTGSLGDRTNYDFINPRTGYRSMVDAKSLVDWYIATEITWNWDGLYSVYMFREPDGPLHFGPLWDEDLAYGNHRQQLASEYQDGVLLAFSNLSWEYRRLQPLVQHFFDDPWFVNAVHTRYNELLDKGLEAYLTGRIDELAQTIEQSAKKNFEKWDIWKVDGEQQYNEGWVNAHYGWTWKQYIDDLRNFIPTRLNKIKTEFDKQMANVQYVGENAVNKPVTGRDQYVVMDRKAKAGVWTTLCLPFDISKGRIEYVFGKGSIVQRFSGVTTYGDGWTALNFSPVDDIKAGTPYIIKPALDVDVPFSLPWRVVNSDAPQTVTHNGCSFTGVYAPIGMSADGYRMVMDDTDGTVKPVTDAGNMKALRAYFTLPADAKFAGLNIEGETNGISDIDYSQKVSVSDVYSIDGKLIGNGIQPPRCLRSGVYIQNGKKVAVKTLE